MYSVIILMKQVIIYTTPSCVYCKMAKDFFKENNVVYQEFDLTTDIQKRNEMFEKSGQMGVPVILIGEEIIIGFDKAKIKKLLSI